MLPQKRPYTVFSRGNAHATLMIISDVPDDAWVPQEKSLLGKVGQLFDAMLCSVGLSEQDVYITSILKCELPEARTPNASEVDACRGFLTQQIQWVAPKLILALGEFTGEFLFGSPMPLGKLRSMLHYYDTIPFIVTYHPRFLVCHPQHKKQAYLDLLLMKKTLQQRS